MEAAGALSRAKNDQLKLAACHETHLAVKPSLEMRESKARNLVLSYTARNCKFADTAVVVAAW
jgi:hypothetical protein